MIFGVNTLRYISKWSREVTYNNFEIGRYKGRYTRGILLLEHASGARSGSKAPPCVSTSSWVYFILVNNNRNESSNMIYALLLTPERGVLLVIFGGGLPPVLQILTLFHTKKCHFPYPFADQISKIQTHFSRMALFSLFQALT